ncbi:MAG TPA: hypothetical protein VIV10_03625 [Gemmatimonadales bacterium]
MRFARAGFRALARFALRAGFFAFLAFFAFRAAGRLAFFFFAGAFRGFGRGWSSIMGSSIIGAGSGVIEGSGGNIGSIMPGPPIPVRSLVASI